MENAESGVQPSPSERPKFPVRVSRIPIRIRDIGETMVIRRRNGRGKVIRLRIRPRPESGPQRGDA